MCDASYYFVVRMAVVQPLRYIFQYPHFLVKREFSFFRQLTQLDHFVRIGQHYTKIGGFGYDAHHAGNIWMIR